MDAYSKAVLTLIAVSLAVIAFKPQFAGAQYGQGCGEARGTPCYVRILGGVSVEGDVSVQGTVEIDRVRNPIEVNANVFQ